MEAERLAWQAAARERAEKEREAALPPEPTEPPPASRGVTRRPSLEEALVHLGNAAAATGLTAPPAPEQLAAALASLVDAPANDESDEDESGRDDSLRASTQLDDVDESPSQRGSMTIGGPGHQRTVDSSTTRRSSEFLAPRRSSLMELANAEHDAARLKRAASCSSDTDDLEAARAATAAHEESLRAAQRNSTRRGRSQSACSVSSSCEGDTPAEGYPSTVAPSAAAAREQRPRGAAGAFRAQRREMLERAAERVVGGGGGGGGPAVFLHETEDVRAALV